MRSSELTGDKVRSPKLANVELFPLLIALAIAWTVALLSIRDWTLYEQARQEARRLGQVIEHANGLLSYLTDAETAQRGYLLTGKAAYMQPYQHSLAHIRSEYDALAAAARVDSRPQLLDLKALIDLKLAEVQQTIQARSDQGFAVALAIVQNDQGEHAMDVIRQHIAELVRVSTNGRLASQERVRTSVTMLRWVSVFGSLVLVGLLAIAQLALRNVNAKRLRLIAELQGSRDEIAAARDLLQTTLEGIGEAVIATDAEGLVTFVNPAAQQLTGWNHESAVNVPLHGVFRILNETTREYLENPVEKVIRTGRTVGLANHTVLVTSNGREIPIDDSAAPIRGCNGEVVGAVLVFRDITERRRTERELLTGRAELERSNATLQKMNTDLELFAYAASHDLQEPLRTIATFSALAAKRLKDNAETTDYMQLIQSAVRNMWDVIEGLLSYSQLASDKGITRSMVQVEEVVGEVLLNCQTAITESGATVHTGPLPAITCNRQQLLQLFQNLISNAIKYRGERTPDIHITAASTNGDWLFSVQDNGIGLDMRYAESIFQAFRRLHGKEEYPGTGLGLAMCKRIVELHSGRIWVEAEDGSGSIFRFTIGNRR